MMGDAADGSMSDRPTRLEFAVGDDGLAEWSGRWEELADVVGAPPWWRPDWVRAWTAAFGRDGLELIVATRGESLVGVVPVLRKGRELRSTTNYHTPSFGLLARDEPARRALADTLVEHAPARLSVAFLPAGEETLPTLAAAARDRGRRTVTRALERCPYVIPDGDFDAYLAGRRGKMTRELRRRERRLKENGRLTFDVHDGRDDLDELLEEGLAVEAAGWKGQRGTAIASSASTQSFYAEVARSLAARGALRLAFLRLDGRAFAFDFAVEEGGVHSLLKTGYDPDFRAFGPGMLLRARMLQRAFELGVRRYDFLGRDDPWKREWMTHVEEQMLFQAFRGPTGLVDWSLQTYARPIARRLLKR